MKKIYTGREWSQNRFARFQVGIIIALLFVIYAFNYESQPVHYDPDSFTIEPDEIEQLVEVYVEKPPKFRQFQTLEKVSELVLEKPLEIFKPELVDTDIISDDVTDEDITTYKQERAVQLPLPEEAGEVMPEIEASGFVTMAERMPLFQDCLDKFENYEEQLACTTEKLMTTIRNNLKYPALARENGIEATVIGSFIVTSEGEISEIKVERSTEKILDLEVLKVFKKLPKLVPGEQNKRQVNVKMYIPVHFKLSTN
ncbi:energy transducer TonB [Portibacter lacus]|uniref:TonB C-terminal domain-containing protein n=1 Tax=Portibacter lacus TaxID=1099794 RepID=A0AA37SSS2_9BACT|nr:energy transducer TonB [Portibacter lacus]GLR17508.1 hypothetical protein GCM10007940_21230 [Portibacter lacus]